MNCSVCGGSEFSVNEVLWPKLIADWLLSADEVRYVNAQQGTCCTKCGANLRSIALSDALLAYFGIGFVLNEVPAQPAAQAIAVLEINEAGTLSPILRQLTKYHFAGYPDVDMHALPYPDATFDLVIHSDTLEHVANPLHALVECRRVLKSGGGLCFTVPTIVGRMSRTRDGLPDSHHGNEAASPDDFVVRTEFGCDSWTFLFRAGFSRLEMFSVEYPAAIAYLARK